MNLFETALEKQKEAGLYRALKPLLNSPAKYVIREGVQCLNLASNNYLDLAGHPLIRQRAQEALDEAGTSSGGSRLLGGNLPLHELLELALQCYRPMGRALTFNTGYQANTTLIPTLGNFLGGVFADKLVHASVVDGLRLLQVPFHRFRHNDCQHLETLLQKKQPPEGGLVVIESLYSMDGDFSPLKELFELQRRFGFWLLIDEAHSTGAYSEIVHTGWSALNERTVIMGTFGKALGSFGSYVVGPSEVIETMINFGRGFIFSTALPPAVLGANLGALEAVQHEDELWRAGHLKSVSAFARESLIGNGFDLGTSTSHILPIHFDSIDNAAMMSAQLFNSGIHAPPIRPPTVPKGTSRLRLNLTSAFAEDDVNHLVNELIAARTSLAGKG